MPIAKVLLVDDDVTLGHTLAKILEMNGFQSTLAANVPDALKLISAESFDVLISDLHMPGAGDGLTVVSAMRHSNPKAITMLFSAFPEMGAAAHAIMMQADEILVKPMKVDALIDTIKQRLAQGSSSTRVVESVAEILERSADSTIDEWYKEVQSEAKLTVIPLTFAQRSGHLPQMFRDLVRRLRSHEELGTKTHVSAAAIEHGIDRRRQGYTAGMMVEESRRLQVCIFRSLQQNLASIDYSILLIGVMTIADEVDSQLSQAMESYLAESVLQAVPA